MFTKGNVSIKSFINVMAADIIKRDRLVRHLTTVYAHNNNGGVWQSCGRIFVNGRRNLWRISNF